MLLYKWNIIEIPIIVSPEKIKRRYEKVLASVSQAKIRPRSNVTGRGHRFESQPHSFRDFMSISKKRKTYGFLLRFSRRCYICLYFSSKRRANNLRQGEALKQPPDVCPEQE